MLGTSVGVNHYADGLAILDAGGDLDYDGASGRIEFDANGAVTSAFFIVTKVSGGALENLEPIEFSE